MARQYIPRQRVTLNMSPDHVTALQSIAKFRNSNLTAALYTILEAHLGDHREAARLEWLSRNKRMFGTSDPNSSVAD